MAKRANSSTLVKTDPAGQFDIGHPAIGLQVAQDTQVDPVELHSAHCFRVPVERFAQ